MYFSARIIWAVIGMTAICRFQDVAARIASSEYKLIEELLGNYDVNILPSKNATAVIDVTFDLAVNQLLELDGRTQTLTLIVWIRQYWRDWNLRWDPKDHGNVSAISLFTSRIWHPDIVIYNRVLMDDIFDVHNIYSASITHEGDVAWLMPRIYKTACNLNMQYFPWDKQVCPVQIGSWSYDGSKLNLLNKTSGVDLTSYIESGEWHMQRAPVTRQVSYYTCCPNPYTSLEYELHLKRKPLYYIINLLAPSCFIGVTAIIAFISPASSGEKIGLSITVLLASTVFLLVVDQAMPIQSDVIPMIGYFYIGLIIILASTTVMTVMIVAIYRKGDYGARVPRWAKVIFLKWLAKALYCHSLAEKDTPEESPHKHSTQNGGLNQQLGDCSSDVFSSSNLTQCVQESSNSNYIHGRDNIVLVYGSDEDNIDKVKSSVAGSLERVVNSLRLLESYLGKREKEDEAKNEWLHLARVLDRLSSVFFLVFMATLAVVVFITPVRVAELMD